MRTKDLMPSLLIAASTLAYAGIALASQHLLGTPSANVPSARENAPPASSLTVKPSQVFANANYGTGGIALRNRSEGVMHISGVVGPSQAAGLYFGYLFVNAPPKSLKIRLRRLFPGPIANQMVKAKLIGVGADPCWGSNGNAVYAAPVPTGFAVGNGEYQIFVPASVVGLNTGEDPWDLNTVFPADEGASLYIIGTGGGQTVDIFGKGLAAIEFQSPLGYTLALSSPTTGATVLMDSIGMDGQVGGISNGRNANSGTAGETTVINSVQVAGSGSPYDPDSDWNGDAGHPLPQMWDDNGHDITPAAPSGTGALNVTINPPGDCLATVANIVQH